MFIYGHQRTALIQEQGHPNQVLSLESHPICTSLHIHSPSPVLSPKPSAPTGTQRPSGALPRVASCWQHPVPAAGPSPLGSAGAVLRAHRLQLGQLQAVVPHSSRVWLQVIAPAASGSPCLALQTGNKSPGRSSYKVSVHGPPKRKQPQTPNVCPGQSLVKAPWVFFLVPVKSQAKACHF